MPDLFPLPLVEFVPELRPSLDDDLTNLPERGSLGCEPRVEADLVAVDLISVAKFDLEGGE